MARAKVKHSTNACAIIFEGDKSSPEPETGVIKFPGGNVEVSRCTDGDYWVHIAVEKPENIVNSRMAYDHATYEIVEEKIPNVPFADKIQHIAIKVKKS